MHKHAGRRRRRAGFQQFSFVDGGDDAGDGYFRRSAAAKKGGDNYFRPSSAFKKRSSGRCSGLQANGVNSAGKSFPSHGCVSVCGTRREMEDATAVVPSFSDGCHFFAVYDGHGGSRVALRCADRLHGLVVAELDRSAPPSAGFDRATWGRALAEAFLRLDAEVCCQDDDNEECVAAGGAAPCTDGSTAVVAVVGRDEIAVANCGDSRAVLSRGGAAIPLTRDHKPDRADETARIEAAGGRVIFWNGYRVLGVLATSRAIGDGYLKPYVIAEPEVTFSSRCPEDECLILASDGLWDVVSNETACEVARRCLAGGRSKNRDGLSAAGLDTKESSAAVAAAVLGQLAIARGSSDNISVVVVDLRQQ